jgi:hypothetical protein
MCSSVTGNAASGEVSLVLALGTGKPVWHPCSDSARRGGGSSWGVSYGSPVLHVEADHSRFYVHAFNLRICCLGVLPLQHPESGIPTTGEVLCLLFLARHILGVAWISGESQTLKNNICFDTLIRNYLSSH